MSNELSMPSINNLSSNEVDKDDDSKKEPRRDADKGDARRFSRLISKKEGAEKAGAADLPHGLPKPVHKETRKDPGLRGYENHKPKSDDKDMSQALAGQTEGARAAQGDAKTSAPQTEITVGRDVSIDALADKIAAQIRVSAPQSGSAEVHIKLNMDTLGGANIILKHDAAGLTVTFEATSAAVAQKLAETKGQLETRLQNTLTSPVHVDVKQADDGRGQPGDGRSRNQYQPYDDGDGDDA